MSLLDHLSVEHRQAVEDAFRYVRERYEPWAVLAAGTIIRGNADAHSDVDLYVLHDAPFRQRVQRRFGGIPVEIFVNPESSVRKYLEEEEREGRPITAHMLATAVVLEGEQDPRLDELLDLARTSLESRPEWAESDLTEARYSAALLFEDALDRRDADAETAMKLLGMAMNAALEFWFKRSGCFIPRHKDVLTEVDSADQSLGELCRRFWGDHPSEDRWVAALSVADRTIGTHHFFEWESEEGPVESSA
jgi:hypothetical protein